MEKYMAGKRRKYPIAFILLAVLTLSVVAQTQRPITPKEKIVLFNGRDLTGLYTWLPDSQYQDPRQIFTVTESGMLRVSGDGVGYICTRDSYRDYHLILEYIWGQKTWGKRVEAARDSGLIVHCSDPDGSHGAFMAGIEAQMIEGGTGDILVLPGKREDGSTIPASVTARVIQDRDGETVWSEKGEEKVITSGRINWFGRDVDWKDVKGFRGRQDVEYPNSAWNRYEVICRGDHIEYRLNGVKVNEGYKVVPSYGKILLQTEWAEVLVRRWELWPLGKAPKYQPDWRDR